MEILKIARDRLMITFSKEELQNRALAGKETPEDHERFVRALIGLIKEKTGIPMGGKWQMTMFPASDGGCELFVYRGEPLLAVVPVTPEKERPCYLVTAEPAEQSGIRALFTDLGVECELFSDETRGALYVWCRPEEKYRMLLEEFGVRTSESLYFYLSEHYLPLGSLF